MKIYHVQYKNWNDTKQITVVARSVAKAVEVAEKWIKKNHYNSSDIRVVSFEGDVTVVQK